MIARPPVGVHAAAAAGEEILASEVVFDAILSRGIYTVGSGREILPTNLITAERLRLVTR